MVIVHNGGMKHQQQRHNRRSTRLRGYDYAKPGACFVTIVTQDRASLFGTIKDGQMQLNDAGKMVLKWYFELEQKFPCVKCDVVVCMPDHIHFLIFIIDDGLGDHYDMHGGDHHDMHGGDHHDMHGGDHHDMHGGDHHDMHGGDHHDMHGGNHHDMHGGNHHDMHGGDHHDMHGGDHAGSPLLGDIVGWFKTMTTNEYIRGVRHSGWPAFNRRLWQRNYYDHIVRTAESLNNIRQYIIDNPRMGDPMWSPESVGATLCGRP